MVGIASASSAPGSAMTPRRLVLVCVGCCVADAPRRVGKGTKTRLPRRRHDPPVARCPYFFFLGAFAALACATPHV
jgi:hypothetical protein